MECAAVQKDCDSDTDTVVCLLSDDEDDPEKINKIWSRKNGIQRSPPRWATNDGRVRDGARRFSSEVIYVRDSDSDSESGSEGDCVILDTASPGKMGVASRLPADFFDRETPPPSPRRAASTPRHPDKRSHAENDRDKSVKVRDVKVKLARIDELLLKEFAVSSGYEEHGILEPVSCKSVSETKHVDNLDKNYSAPSVNTSERRLVPTERSPGKGNEICKNSSHGVKSFSPDKSKKIRITLEIPYSKVLQFKNSRQSEFRSVTSSEDFYKTSKTKISQERKDGSLSKSQLSSKDVEENSDVVEVDLTKGDKQAENDSCNRWKPKKSKSHSRHENKYRCEICWLRVSNVTDHIVTQHTHLFT